MAILDEVKSSLRITHTDDDVLLARLIAAASEECANYIYGSVPDYTAIDAVADPQTVEALKNGIIILVQAGYEGDPLNRDVILESVIKQWRHYRTGFSL